MATQEMIDKFKAFRRVVDAESMKPPPPPPRRPKTPVIPNPIECEEPPRTIPSMRLAPAKQKTSVQATSNQPGPSTVVPTPAKRSAMLNPPSSQTERKKPVTPFVSPFTREQIREMNDILQRYQQTPASSERPRENKRRQRPTGRKFFPRESAKREEGN
ncbi:hypothetical protein DAEQUDRAFT_77404 [Daedalea quercina L-15889]|uniref:Uncharacterized protein n=1 Tax=Daedalea quercina L-15889 TaxID=1314783 RepID=A0A165SFC1_9APHY|nr:hypothetical protein DAEQUDRAFT_77404 [Daedalea quercina L-15889]